MNASLARRLAEVARVHGEFRLRSGRTASTYFDKYQITARPTLLQAVAEELVHLIPDDVDLIAGLELGAIPVAIMISQILDRPTVFVRKEPKEYGTERIAEGPDVSGKKVVVIEDVVTSGGQLVQSIEVLRKLGGQVACACCIIDREGGGADALTSIGVELQPLFTERDLDRAFGIDTSPG